MRSVEWQQRYAEVGTWRREFGPQGVPVSVVAASPEMQAICDLIHKIRDGEPHTVLVHALSGGGKSTIVSAALAEFAEHDVAYRVLTPGEDLGQTKAELGKSTTGARIVIDNCDDLKPAELRTILEKRQNCGGLLLTATKTSRDLTALLSGVTDHYIVLPILEQRADDLLLIASVMWEGLAGTRDLAAVCDDTAVTALLGGPHPTGAWSVQRVLSEVLALRADGDGMLAGRTEERISYGDIAPAFIQMYKESIDSNAAGPANAVLVVEGETDEKYLLRAATLAEERFGWNLLDGLSVQAAAPERGGGASEVGRRLLACGYDGVTAVGLFDYDLPGNSAFETAKRVKSQVMRIPPEFDALARSRDTAVVEAEDLLPSEVLLRYYETHEDQSPEEWHWRLDRLRVVPRGKQKGELAEWVCEVASYEDMERFVYLLIEVRKQVHLPCPTTEKTWRSRLSTRATIAEPNVVRAGLNSSLESAETRCDALVPVEQPPGSEVAADEP